MLVSDERVYSLYGRAVEESYAAAGYSVDRFTFPPGEASKNLGVFGSLMNALADARYIRSDIIVALGGGVTGDLAGFAASAYTRGIRYIQIPTTLLAAVDSSVGGKTAVNLNAGKNLAGAFWQPSLVLCDTDILRDLPGDLLSDGAAEAVKYGVLRDEALFDTLAAGRLIDALDYVVETSVCIKRDLVNEDEFDTGARQLLNLGHTIGHAIESCSKYEISHGRAVAIGLYRIARAAEVLGINPPGLSARIRTALAACGLSTECGYTADELANAALSDKKRRGGMLTLIVPREIGRCELMEAPIENLRDWITAGEGAL
jgi:3-dehydroquinate synthase